MTDLPPRTEPTARNAGLDALRAATTLLVVFHHTAITYGGSGGWFYREIVTGDSWPSRLLSFFCALNQAWFMGLFFLLAGYFTPAALARKGELRFLADRVLRLGLPWLVFVLLLGPLTIALAQTARGRPFGATLGWLAGHPVFEPGPLWFAQALLVCAVGALLWQAGAGAGRAWGRPEAPFPSDRALALAALATGAAAFGLRLVWPVGATVAGLQPGYCASYLVLFAAGCAAATPRWLERLPAAAPRRWRRVARWALPVLPLVALFGPALPWLQGRVEGGLSLPAALYAFWEPLVAWGVLLGLLSLFQRRFARPGPLGQALARRAFAIFVIHLPVLVAVALAWAGVPAPALLKFMLTGSLACALCYGLAGLLLRLPGVARVL
jgi:peptidoglycan/LPS O-acetylase OafA/YrhL